MQRLSHEKAPQSCLITLKGLADEDQMSEVSRG